MGERGCSEVVQYIGEVGEVEEAGWIVLYELLEQSSCYLQVRIWEKNGQE